MRPGFSLVEANFVEFWENFQFFPVNQLWKISSSAGVLANRAEDPFYFLLEVEVSWR